MKATTKQDQPIGVYDSGVGGLSVLKAIQVALPHESLIYLGDQAKVPYGGRSLPELRKLGLGVTHFLLSQGAKLIVIACNTASSAALQPLRQIYPEVPFVGMEPAVKPAAEQTQTGNVGVLATPSTFQGELYASVVERFARGVKIYQETCPGLVSQIEKGYLNTPKTRKILERALLPLLDKGVDTLVLGCTHFPFVIPLIQEIAAGKARVIDPAPAVARQVARVLGSQELSNPSTAIGTARYYTTGNPKKFQRLLFQLIGAQAEVTALEWHDGELHNPVDSSPQINTTQI